jgi:hypothetical protein
MIHELFMYFRKAYNSGGREVFYSILTEFGIPLKLVRLIQMCLNKTTIALEYAIWKFQENQDGLELNGAYLPMDYADNVNILGKNMNTINTLRLF